jgi:tryptophanyl-tRNA synthetase
MVYRDFVWNTNKGIIEKVKKLTFDATSKQFNINFSKKGNSNAASARSIKKKTELEQKINDELLYFLVKTKGIGTLETFISNIQNRVNITKNDKKMIETHFNTFKDVVLKKLEEHTTA